jgi:hypothetical protein
MSNLPHGADAANPSDDWGEPVSVCSDAEALDDGILFDLGQFTRVAFLGLPITA